MQLYTLGSKSELLVTTWKDEEKGPYRVVCTTDNASDIILHWGVKKSGKSWKRPDASFVPEGSELIEDGIAAETPFVGCTDDECHVEIGGSVVPLQRIELVIPDKAGISALTFVLRSGDGMCCMKSSLAYGAFSNSMSPVTCRIKVVEGWCIRFQCPPRWSLYRRG